MKPLKGVIGILVALLISSANGEESMVRVDVRYVAYPKADINALLKKDIGRPVSLEDLSTLLKQGTGRIISSQSLVTLNRYSARILDANTLRIASDVDVELIKLTSETNMPVAAIAEPGGFENYNIGISLTVTPVVSDGQKSVALEIESEYIEDIEMRPMVIGNFHSEKGVLDFTEERAEIKSHKIHNTITIPDGETLLIGGGTTTKENEDLYLFVSCKILSGGSVTAEEK